MRFIYAIIDVIRLFLGCLKWCLNASFQVMAAHLLILAILIKNLRFLSVAITNE